MERERILRAIEEGEYEAWLPSDDGGPLSETRFNKQVAADAVVKLLEGSNVIKNYVDLTNDQKAAIRNSPITVLDQWGGQILVRFETKTEGTVRCEIGPVGPDMMAAFHAGDWPKILEYLKHR